ncbi:40972_t:CDS:2, partial [Gigaspora margarita]
MDPELPQEFFHYVLLLQILCNGLNSISFEKGKITVTRYETGKLRKQRITRTYELKNFIKTSNLLDEIRNRENQIQNLRNVLEYFNYGHTM